MPVDIGTGASIVFGTSGFAANITNISQDDATRPDIDTTHLGTTTARTFTPGDLYDPGGLTLDIQWDVNDTPPITGEAETVTLTFPKSNATNTAGAASFTGYVNSYNYVVPLEELMTGQVTVKASGALAYTAEQTA